MPRRRRRGPTCPYCGEPWDGGADEGGGAQQVVVEDCAVCCRPCVVTATYDVERGEHVLEVAAEGRGAS